MRYGLDRPGAVAAADEASLRYAFALTRRLCDAEAAPGIDELTRSVAGAAAALFGPSPWRSPHRPEPELIAAAARRLWAIAMASRDAAASQLGLTPERLDGEVRQRQLVLALGGGGGCCYVYLGCFALLEEWNLVPALIAGTSMGAVLGLVRCRSEHFDLEETEDILGQLSYRKLFRPLDPAEGNVRQRVAGRGPYTVPGPFRLFLRSALGPHFGAPDAGGLPTLGELPIPLAVAVTGIRPGMLPRPLEAYERLFAPRSLFPPTPRKLRRKASEIVLALAELLTQPHRLTQLYLGADPETQSFDALDAVGFSTSLPGVVHYEALRDDPGLHEKLAAFLRDRELGWFADGGLAESCPARTAFVASQRLGRAPNPLILALDAFSPKLSTPAWLPLERLAHENVRRALPWASLYVPFDRTLSPLDLVPRLAQARRAVALGRARLAPELPLLARLLERLPDLAQSRPASG